MHIIYTLVTDIAAVQTKSVLNNSGKDSTTPSLSFLKKTTTMDKLKYVLQSEIKAVVEEPRERL